MTVQFRWAPIALALVLAACGSSEEQATAPAGNESAAAPAGAPAGQDWTETVVATPEGGFRMGNPNAPVKLVEYASLTCPHCADFSAAATEPLRNNYVRDGRVSWEFRNFVLNPVDVTATLLARCQGAGPFFKLVEQTYAEQRNWGARYAQVSEAEVKRMQGLPENQQFQALAAAGGLDQFFRARGLPADKANACLADKSALDQIVAIRDRGVKQDGVTGTPSFLINGQPAEGAIDWNTLQAKLNAALEA